MKSREEVIQTIKELYRLAESTTSESEATTAIAAAERLLQKYRIEQAEVEQGDKKVFNQEVFYTGTKFPTWKRRILMVLGRNYGCFIFTTKYNWQAFGRPDDMSLLRIQYERIIDQIDRLTLRNCKGQGKSFSDSYRKGVVVTVATRLLQSYAEATQNSTAIVKLDNRQAEAEEDFKSKHETKAISFPRKMIQVAAYEQGKKDGHQVHTGAYLDNGRAKKVLNG